MDSITNFALLSQRITEGFRIVIMHTAYITIYYIRQNIEYGNMYLIFYVFK